VGGTSLSAPAWAGLLALVNQGRAAASGSTLNSTSPTETQQALYSLPQSDYNVIASGNNGYTAGSGYNLVTGLGTPVANLLVPDLVAYQGPGTSYLGPSVGPLQDASLVDSTAAAGGPVDVFSVFDSLTVASNGIGHTEAVGTGSTNRAILKTVAPGSRTAGSMRPVAASAQTSTPGTTNQGLMALDSVISNWTPASNPMTKRLTAPMAGDTVSVDIGGARILPAMNVGTRSPVLPAGILDALVAGSFDIPSLFADTGQRNPSHKIKTLRG
jgi:subtilase family serine protease